MRIQHRYLTYDFKIIKAVRKLLDKFSQEYIYKEDLDCVIPSLKYFLEFFIYENTPNFYTLKEELSKYKIQSQIGTIYEKVDIDNAEWFIINTGSYQYPQPEDNYKEATFNLENYCKHCGLGKVQKAPFRLKTEPKQHNNQFWGLHWEYEPIFVRQEAKNILEKEKIKGISFSNPVLNKKDKIIEGFYQMHIKEIAEEGFDNHNAQTITCKINNEENCNTDLNIKCCRRIKYHHPQIGGYLFDKIIFDKSNDIVMSKEYFGSGASANRLKIVSKNFKDLVERNKLKGLYFKPILHERIQR